MSSGKVIGYIAYVTKLKLICEDGCHCGKSTGVCFLKIFPKHLFIYEELCMYSLRLAKNDKSSLKLDNFVEAFRLYFNRNGRADLEDAAGITDWLVQ